MTWEEVSPVVSCRIHGRYAGEARSGDVRYKERRKKAQSFILDPTKEVARGTSCSLSTTSVLFFFPFLHLG
jgi:hypothetical protein